MKQRNLIIGILMLVVFLGVGGYLFTNQKSNNSRTSNNTSQKNSITTTTTDGEVATKAQRFAESVSNDLRTSLVLDYSLSNAQKWSNFPPMGYRERVGPTFSQLDETQLGDVKTIIKSASGTKPNEGWDEIEQILNADDYLNAQTGENGFTSGNYHIAFLGTPSNTGKWELYFGGHHLAFANTYKDGKLISATPSFRGVEPFTTFSQNGRENQPMQQEQAAFADMIGSLSSDQQSKAKLSSVLSDIVAGPQKDDQIPITPSGIKVSELSEEQKKLVIAAMNTYVDDIDDANAKTILTKYTNELDDTFIAYSGTPAIDSANDYVRIDGPSVWIEFSMQKGASLPGPHPHSVWRDKILDYGGTI
ncbi:MAG: DUF3500 domain-containing protein [Patescibacteria group bacterium]